MIQATNISYIIKGRHILNNVSFVAEEGEVLVILGSNGAGKSTLLKIISGELKDVSGEVSIQNKMLGSWRVNELARFRAVLQQQTNISLPYPVKDVVLMGRYPHFKNNPAPVDGIIVRNALKRTGIEHLADRNYLTLSGGEQQRVQLARVMAQVWVNDTYTIRYLMMDEPLNNLDIAHQHSTLQLAKEFAAEGNCVIAVLHDLNLAIQYADKILLLKNSSTVAVGRPEDILNDEIISETYDFPLNILKHPVYTYPVVTPAISKHSNNNYNASNANRPESTIRTS